MKMRTVEIIRRLTLEKSIYVEIPESVSNEELRETLYNRMYAYEELVYGTHVQQMSEEDEVIEVEDSKRTPTTRFKATDKDWSDAMMADGILK
jgi:hypothetical protein